MITINLQYIALVFWSLAFGFLVRAAYWFASTKGKPDLAPVMGVALALKDVITAAMLAGLGLLIYWAFRA